MKQPFERIAMAVVLVVFLSASSAWACGMMKDQGVKLSTREGTGQTQPSAPMSFAH